MTYTARAVRDDAGWWVIDVEGVGVTQARTPAEAQRMAVDLVDGMLDEPNADVDIHFVGLYDRELAKIRLEQAKAEKALAKASADLRAQIAKMAGTGLKQADIAAVLHVSKQRMSQLSKSVTPGGFVVIQAKTSVKPVAKKSVRKTPARTTVKKSARR